MRNDEICFFSSCSYTRTRTKTNDCKFGARRTQTSPRKRQLNDKHLVLARRVSIPVLVEIQSKHHLARMIRRFILFALIHLSSALFESCDETFELETDANLTISSGSSLSARNVSSCRFTIVAPVNFIIDVTCRLQINQPESQKCPLKRFFVSVDGIRDLRGADYFCSRNASMRTVRRRSIMNRLVLAYATQVEVDDESFECVARRIASKCDCGWAKRVS